MTAQRAFARARLGWSSFFDDQIRNRDEPMVAAEKTWRLRASLPKNVAHIASRGTSMAGQK